ncbi:hypothetical protein FIU82_07550 [Pseudoalteromonas sp. THAF3]|uniref:hypothetical protein n=1 Tax=unclassified Pseudoalteromonas TaxID=194690 RepID=UPI0006B5404A|nr:MULTISPECIES: hypothetical protein [unclassified Pseudoalteromonas]QFU04867.1 hypothetical protein FIU82_07550 [Pseudoalteromonas sp. THAF3]GAP76769.1 phage protein [Pseudoalteromonas sp. SW0106-04]|tara:strand:- start:9032 stop:9355 length:324 start_codon:yes stop_codon:yes gene_type:complete
MGKEIYGKITCPHCGSRDATVHKQASRNAKWYYRCYDGPNGPCGTVQIPLPGGQKFIEDNMRSLNEAEASEAAHEVSEQARERQERVAAKAQNKKSLLSRMFEDEDE